MLRIYLRELEEAIKDPAAYKDKMRNRSADSGHGHRATYYSALRDAIFRFHDTKDIGEAGNYLYSRLDRFKKRNQQKQQNINEQFMWYIDEYNSRNVDTIDWRFNIVVPLPDRVLEPIPISGQIGRFDFNNDTRGYSIWLFRNRGYEGWQDEFRMPLIQHAISRKMYTPIDRIKIGIYSFEDRYIDATSYSEQVIEDAREQLDHFLQKLGI